MYDKDTCVICTGSKEHNNRGEFCSRCLNFYIKLGINFPSTRAALIVALHNEQPVIEFLKKKINDKRLKVKARDFLSNFLKKLITNECSVHDIKPTNKPKIGEYNVEEYIVAFQGVCQKCKRTFSISGIVELSEVNINE